MWLQLKLLLQAILVFAMFWCGAYLVDRYIERRRFRASHGATNDRRLPRYFPFLGRRP